MANQSHLKVTVAMPAYNASRYIREIIQSVLAQDYDSFELLICNDASKDNTLKIINEFRTHPKVRIFSNKTNLGPGATRNKLSRLAKGQYITPCDADDLMLPGNLKRLSGILDADPHCGVVYANVLKLDVNKENKILKIPQVLGKNYKKAWDLMENAINHPGSMIRKSLILKVGGYDETVYSVDDWSLWLKLAEVTEFKYLEKEIYYLWRRNPASATRVDKRFSSDADKIIQEAIRRRYGKNLRTEFSGHFPARFFNTKKSFF